MTNLSNVIHFLGTGYGILCIILLAFGVYLQNDEFITLGVVSGLLSIGLCLAQILIIILQTFVWSKEENIGV